MSIRDIAIEAAAIAMGRADLDGHTLGMRDRRKLAEIAFDAAARTIATDLRAEGDRLKDVATQTKSVPGFAHALSFEDAARYVTTTTTTPPAREQCEQIDCHNFGGWQDVCGTGPLFASAGETKTSNEEGHRG